MGSIGIDKFKKINRTMAWIAFAVALCTYWLTAAPTTSYWDCPEYVASACNLEPGHPPGNPIFMLAARFCINFAPDSSYAALAVNLMSGLLSAFTIFFLYLTISIFVSRIGKVDTGNISLPKAILTEGCALTGALIYTWSDTFWFSAVEAEVYSFASFMTAAMVWLMLKWAECGSRDTRYRYIILISYLTGISIAVHLLNLLCLPALFLIVAYRKYPAMRLWQAIVCILVSFICVALILFGMVPGSLKLSQAFELLSVNHFGAPYNSGFIIFVIVFFIAVLSAIITTRKLHRPKAETAAWSIAFMMLGFMSYTTIIIRANANPPMNQGSPDNPFTFASYIERDQYGKHPLLYGPTPYSPLMYHESLTTDSTGAVTSVSYKSVVRDKKNPRYCQFMPDARYDMRSSLTGHDDTLSNRHIETSRHGYVLADYTFDYVHAPELDMFLPRIFSSEPSQIAAYKNWCGMSPENMDSVTASTALDKEGKPIGRLNLATGKREKEKYPKPTVAQNLEFMMKYQIGYMYLRYFLWNFSGRQNDVPSQGQVDAGNFITGITPIDNAMLGNQSYLPKELGRDNKGRHNYFMLPLLLGIVGMIYQWRRGRKGRHDFNIVLTLFLMTGLAIVVYLNQTTGEPRERDYSFAESFYAFSIWVGMGVAGTATGLRRLLQGRGNERIYAVCATIVGIGTSLLMLAENHADHNRSGQYAARDFAINTLESLEPQAILFVNGDNYTFPLWYAQEVEHIRRDVRVINLAYLSTGWYVRQLMTQAYESRPLPFTMSVQDIAYGAHAINMIAGAVSDTLDAVDALHFFYSSDPSATFPSHNLRLTELPGDESIVIDANRLSGGKKYLSLAQLAVLDIIATNAADGWSRPIYWSGGTVISDFMGMEPYLVQEGYSYRLTPYAFNHKRMDVEKTYRAVTEKFRWGGAEKGSDTYFDPNSGKMISEMRGVLIALAQNLISNGRFPEARQILLLADQKLSDDTWQYTTVTKGFELHNQGAEIGDMMAETGLKLSDTALYTKGMRILEKQITRSAEYLRYTSRLPNRLKGTTSINVRNERSAFYAPIEAYLRNGGKLENVMRIPGIKGINLENERKRWELNMAYRELIGNARRYNAYGRLTTADYAHLPIEERRTDTAFYRLIDRYCSSGGKISTLQAAKEFKEFDFARIQAH